VQRAEQVKEAVMKPAPTRERVKRVMEEVDALGLSDGAYWAAVQRMLGLDEGEVFEIIAEDMTYFGFGQI
jgi:hypothetical protein